MKANTVASPTESNLSIETRRSRFRLRELTYRYQVKKGIDGRPITLGAQITNARDSWTAVRSFLQDEAVEVLGILCIAKDT